MLRHNNLLNNSTYTVSLEVCNLASSKTTDSDSEMQNVCHKVNSMDTDMDNKKLPQI